LPYLWANSSAVPSIRQSQVGELIRRHFSMLLLEQGRQIFGNALVTVTEVKMSPDLTLAKVYLSVYNTDNKQAVLLEMEEQHPQLRQGLANRVRHHMRRVPDLAFYLDDTLDEMERVDQLFHKLHAEDQMGPVREEE
jgi:ribosome-binding factor A